MTEDIRIDIQYADKTSGTGRVPVTIKVTKGDDLLYASAIYAKESEVKLPKVLKEACRTAPRLESVKSQLERQNIQIMV